MARYEMADPVKMAYDEAYRSEYRRNYQHYLDAGEPEDIAHRWAHDEALVVAREAEDNARDIARYGYAVHYGIPALSL